MAAEIGKQNRQTPSDDEVQAANDGRQERRVDAGSTSDVITNPHPIPRAQSEDTTGDALRNDQRQDGTSVEMSGMVADHSHDNLGFPIASPVPYEERDKWTSAEIGRKSGGRSALAAFSAKAAVQNPFGPANSGHYRATIMVT